MPVQPDDSATLPQTREPQLPPYPDSSWHAPPPPEPPSPAGLSADAWALIGVAIVLAIFALALAGIIFIGFRGAVRRQSQSRPKVA